MSVFERRKELSGKKMIEKRGVFKVKGTEKMWIFVFTLITMMEYTISYDNFSFNMSLNDKF